MRLDKMLGNLGYGTRSEIKTFVRQGKITVNGLTAKDPGMHIDPARDVVAWDGKTVRYRDKIYVMLHKPAGVVSATEDLRERTVLDLLDPGLTVFSLFPVGRLDKDTEGLLLISNDGKLAHDLLSPRKHVPKTYRALVLGNVGQTEAEAFARGVKLDDGYVTLPAHMRVLASSAAPAAPDDPAMAEAIARLPAQRRSLLDNQPVSWVELTIHEGKFHQVKRMFETVGRKVIYLRRESMGPLQLDPDLAPGEWRELTDAEVASLLAYRKDETG